MTSKVKTATRKSIALAVVLSAILTVAVAYYWPFQDAYYPLNEDWNGCSQVISSARNATIIWSYNTVGQSNDTLLAIIGPRTSFSQDDGVQIQMFLQNGGTVMLADSYGSGNTLLQRLNVSERFSMYAIADLYFYSKNPNFPIITDFARSAITRNLTGIITERPSYLENITQAKVLATSSPFSFIDQGASTRSTNETLKPYPIIADLVIGKGELILLSDPNIFTNQLLPLKDNIHLLWNILDLTGGHLTYDVNHLESAPLSTWRAIFTQEAHSFLSPGTRVGIQAVLVVLIMAIALGVYFKSTRKRANMLS